jgi:hypothetical protein
VDDVAIAHELLDELAYQEREAMRRAREEAESRR